MLCFFGAVDGKPVTPSPTDSSLFRHEQKAVARVSGIGDPAQKAQEAAYNINVLYKSFMPSITGVADKNKETVPDDEEAANQEILRYSYDQGLMVVEHRRKDKTADIRRTYLKGITKIGDVTKKALKYFYDVFDSLKNPTSPVWYKPTQPVALPAPAVEVKTAPQEMSVYAVDMQENFTRTKEAQKEFYNNYQKRLNDIDPHAKIIQIGVYLENNYKKAVLDKLFEKIKNGSDQLFIINLGDEHDLQPVGFDSGIIDPWSQEFIQQLKALNLGNRVILCSSFSNIKEYGYDAGGLNKVENKAAETFELWVNANHVKTRSEAALKITETTHALLKECPTLTPQKIKELLLASAGEATKQNKNFKILDAEMAVAYAKDAFNDNNTKFVEILKARRILEGQAAGGKATAFETLWRNNEDLSTITYQALESTLKSLVFEDASVFKKDILTAGDQKDLQNKLEYIAKHADGLFKNKIPETAKLSPTIRQILISKNLSTEALTNTNSPEFIMNQIKNAYAKQALEDLWADKKDQIKADPELGKAYFYAYIDNVGMGRFLLDNELFTKEAAVDYLKNGKQNLDGMLRFSLEQKKWVTPEDADWIYPNFVKNNIDIDFLLGNRFLPPVDMINNDRLYKVTVGGQPGQTSQTFLAYMLTKAVPLTKMVDKYGSSIWQLSNKQEFVRKYRGLHLINDFFTEPTESVLKLLHEKLNTEKEAMVKLLPILMKVSEANGKKTSAISTITNATDMVFFLQIFQAVLEAKKDDAFYSQNLQGWDIVIQKITEFSNGKKVQDFFENIVANSHPDKLTGYMLQLAVQAKSPELTNKILKAIKLKWQNAMNSVSEDDLYALWAHWLVPIMSIVKNQTEKKQELNGVFLTTDVPSFKEFYETRLKLFGMENEYKKLKESKPSATEAALMDFFTTKVDPIVVSIHPNKKYAADQIKEKDQYKKSIGWDKFSTSKFFESFVAPYKTKLKATKPAA